MRYKSKTKSNTAIKAPLMLMCRIVYVIKRQIKVVVLWIEDHLNIEIRSL